MPLPQGASKLIAILTEENYATVTGFHHFTFCMKSVQNMTIHSKIVILVIKKMSSSQNKLESLLMNHPYERKCENKINFL